MQTVIAVKPDRPAALLRLLTTGNYLGPQRRGLWVELGQQIQIAGMVIVFFEDTEAGERVLRMQVNPVTGDLTCGYYRLPVAHPIRYHSLAQLALLPRSVRMRHGRSEAVYLEYLDFSRRTV